MGNFLFPGQFSMQSHDTYTHMNSIDFPVSSATAAGSDAVRPLASAGAGEIELRAYLQLLRRNLWLILATMLAAGSIGAAYAYLVTPQYEANMLFQVAESSTKEAKNIIGEMNSLFDVKTVVASEMELLRSRGVVAKAVDQLALCIEVSPRYLPVVGRGLARYNRQLSAPVMIGQRGYAWGAERIALAEFNVPETLLDVPFLLTAEAGDRYRLRRQDGGLVLQGRIGERLHGTAQLAGLELLVTQLQARPGIEFMLQRRPRLAVIESVQAVLQVTELGKQSGVIKVSWQGDDARQGSAILAQIAQEYLHQNHTRKTEDAEKSLALLKEQLPDLKRELERTEARYNEFRNVHGTVDVGEAGKIGLQQLAAANVRRAEIEQKRVAMGAQLSSAHPAMIGVDAQLKDVNREISQIELQIKALPAQEQQMVRLARDAKVQADLYTALLNTAQQLRLITVGQMSNVHLVDEPMTRLRPVSPNRASVITIAIAFGLMLGLTIAVMRGALHDTIEDPLTIEAWFGLPVCAAVAYSRWQQKLMQRHRGSGTLPLLARSAPGDAAIEHLRHLRAMLLHTRRQGNNVVLIAGAGSGAGSSFIAANLAVVLAAADIRVLLIDADLRHGQLHRYFDQERGSGLADLIAGTQPLEQVVRRDVFDHLDVISAGSPTSTPAELLLHRRLGTVLKTLSARYDLILIDACALQPWSDTAVLATHAGMTYVVVRAGVTTRRNMVAALHQLRLTGRRPAGVIANASKTVPVRASFRAAAGASQEGADLSPVIALRQEPH
jgi:tyrosine-protein kinase Etk/Wzc